MKNRWAVVIALLCALVVTAQLRADSGKKKGHGNPHANQVVEERGHHGHDDDDRWEHRGNYEYRVYEVRESRPPGWSRGNKTGWGNCGLPPGQAKKYGCRTYVYQERRYYYYEDERGRVIVRRPSVQIHVDLHN
jgi:hypothetical protein